MTTTDITLHTSRTLYDKWNGRYGDIKDRIKVLKGKLKTTPPIDDKRIAEIDAEIQELYIQANLIHQFLADVGLMAYVHDRKERGGIS